MTQVLSWFWSEIKGNLLAVPPCGLVAAVWARWKVLPAWRRHREMIQEVHHKLHTGRDHPRVEARRARGEHPTPGTPSSAP